MNENGYVIRTKEGMEKALSRISAIKEELQNNFLQGREYFETLNIASIAVAILQAALARKESVGAHYREN
jgi:L-aspartate oxidase